MAFIGEEQAPPGAIVRLPENNEPEIEQREKALDVIAPMTASDHRPSPAPRFEILIRDGERLRKISQMFDEQVRSVSVDLDVEKADGASFEITNRKNFTVDHELFKAWKEIEVHIGYGDNLQRMFAGVISQLEPKFPSDGVSTLSVTAQDYSYRMRQVQRVAALKTSDYREAVEKIAKRHGINKSDIEMGFIPPKSATSVQTAETDWELLGKLAEGLGFDVWMSKGKLFFQRRKWGLLTTLLFLEYGRNITEFEPSLEARRSVSKVKMWVWKSGRREAELIEITNSDEGAQLGDESAADHTRKESGEDNTRILWELSARDEKGARRLAQAYFNSKQFDFITGRVTVIGFPAIEPHRLVEIGGVGRKFSGHYYIKSVRHKIDSSGFTTECELARNAVSPTVAYIASTERRAF